MHAQQMSVIEQFIESGWLKLEGAFDRAVADRLRARLIAACPHDPRNRDAWDKPRCVVKQSFGEPDVMDLYSARVRGCFDLLLGAGRWQLPTGTGYGLVNLPHSASGPWKMPEQGWHIDGLGFRHRLASPDQGLLCLALLTDVSPTGGATVVKPGSHRLTAGILADAEPQGLDAEELSRRVREAASDIPGVVMPGRAGDLLVLHPMLLHAGSPNADASLRVATNICVSMHEPLRLPPAPAEDEPTPLEQSLLRALATRQ